MVGASLVWLVRYSLRPFAARWILFDELKQVERDVTFLQSFPHLLAMLQQFQTLTDSITSPQWRHKQLPRHCRHTTVTWCLCAPTVRCVATISEPLLAFQIPEKVSKVFENHCYFFSYSVHLRSVPHRLEPFLSPKFSDVLPVGQLHFCKLYLQKHTLVI